MLMHGPSCLEGPVTAAREWWAGLRSDDAMTPTRVTGFREELVGRVRREIAAGHYDTSEKWEAALDRLFRELDGCRA